MSKPSIFISHVSQDKAYANRLIQALREEDVSVWSALDSMNIGAGWADKIAKAIDKANVFVVLVSPDFLSSQWGMFELGAALGRQWKSSGSIVPVMIRSATLQDLPPPARQFQVVDAHGLTVRSVGKRLAKVIRERAGAR
jgi:TIR domain